MQKAIYLIRNKINGKCYVGQSISPYRRFISHISRSNNNEDNSIIHSAIRKYGKENFELKILEWTEDYNQREKDLIEEYNTLAPNGYNILKGGQEPPHYYGENHHNSVITEQQVDEVIKRLKENELTEPQIGRLFNPPFNQVLINNINWGITHKRKNETYPIRKNCPYNLTKESVEEIRWLLENTLFPCYQIAEYYNVTTSTIKHINTGRNYHVDGYDYPIRKHKGKKQSEPVETILAKRSTTAIDTQLEMGVCT